MDTTRPSNPFHPQAVATYGQVIKTCADLGYMGKALEEVNEYLINYSRADRRYGGSIGFSGGHGSGKTHLLMWLAEKARNLSTTQPIVLYAKADSNSFAELYTQLLSNLKREKLLELINEAVRKLAQAEVGKARATELPEESLASTADLEILDKKGKIDLEQLVIQLQLKLDTPQQPTVGEQETPLPSTVARMLTLLGDSKLGDKAYEWLLGKEVTNLADLNLSTQLFDIQLQKPKVPPPTDTKIALDGVRAENVVIVTAPPEIVVPESSVPDVTAINALETIAALLLIAERPLIILIDQFEVLLRADTKRRQTIFSIVKKMVEQLDSQKALTFIAGTSEPWEGLTLDVTPRLRRRDPIVVGNLSLKETERLLEAYTDSLDSKFSEKAQRTIHALSGGNPREIIRIAYYAYNDESVEGDLSKVNENVLIKSAAESHTVEERNKLALLIVDSVLAEFGGIIRANINVADQISLDRMLISNDQPRLALMTLKATDKLSEINSARQFSVIRNYLEEKWPAVPLICVSVGYSSDEVGKLISTTSTILQFDEKNLGGQLRARITELLAQQQRPADTSTDSNVLQVLEAISERLKTLESKRADEVKDIAERFAEKAQVDSEPARAKRELETRWDMVNAIDDLQDALRTEKLESERGIMRSLLVANEAKLKNKQIDNLGGLYLELIAESPLPWESSGADSFSREQLADTRESIIRELRRLLRGKRAIDNLVEHPWKFSMGASLPLVLAELIYFSSKYRLDLPEVGFAPFFVILLLPFWSLTLAIAIGITFLLRWLRLSKWDRLVNRVRKRILKVKLSPAPDNHGSHIMS